MAKKKEMTPAKRLAAALVPGEEQPYEIPANWQWVKLGSVCEFERGITFPASAKEAVQTEENIPCLRTANVQDRLEIDDLIYVNKSYMKKNDAKLVRQGDIVMSSANSRELVGKTSFVESLPEPMTFGGFVLMIRAKQIANKFLFYFLRLAFLSGHFVGKASQTTNIANINTKTLAQDAVPLPPLAEQQRIVARVEALFAKLDEAEEKILAALAAFDRRRAALLRAAFTGRLTAAWRTAHGRSLDEWEQTEVKSICKEIKVGIVIKPSQYYTTADKGVPAFRSANVREFRVDNFDWVYLDERGQKENPRSIVHTGDILIVRSGNPGTSCVVTEEFDGYNAIDILIAVPKPDKVDSNFLCAYTNSTMGRQLVEANKRGMALAHFNVSKYSKLPISLPTLDEQREIVRVLDETFAREAQARAAAEAALAAVPKLRRAVLARAFRGELGTNDPAEPPALSAD